MSARSFASFALLLLSGAAFAADQDSHTVSVTVEAINEVEIVGGNVSLTISAANPGEAPEAATDASTSLSWSTNETDRKITVATDLAEPSFTLSVQALGVSGGTAAGSVFLTTTPQDLVTGIS